MLQTAVGNDSYSTYKKYSGIINNHDPINLRDLLNYNSNRKSVTIDNVESTNEIRKKLVTPGISFGALSLEAHETLSIAMNRISAKSGSGFFAFKLSR